MSEFLDGGYSQAERARLKGFYRDAEAHTFRGMDHMTGGLFRTEESLALIEAFLKGEPRADGSFAREQAAVG